MSSNLNINLNLRDVPICKRGFLTSVKKSPALPINQLALQAKEVCNGLKPDYNGRKFKSPPHQIKDIQGANSVVTKETHVRPLLPTYEQIKTELKTRFKKNIVLNNKIIGVADVDNKLYLIRPVNVNVNH
jgi:hypothetical protein